MKRNYEIDYRKEFDRIGEFDTIQVDLDSSTFYCRRYQVAELMRRILAQYPKTRVFLMYDSNKSIAQYSVYSNLTKGIIVSECAALCELKKEFKNFIGVGFRTLPLFKSLPEVKTSMALSKKFSEKKYNTSTLYYLLNSKPTNRLSGYPVKDPNVNDYNLTAYLESIEDFTCDLKEKLVIMGNRKYKFPVFLEYNINSFRYGVHGKELGILITNNSYGYGCPIGDLINKAIAKKKIFGYNVFMQYDVPEPYGGNMPLFHSWKDVADHSNNTDMLDAACIDWVRTGLSPRERQCELNAIREWQTKQE